MRALYKSKNKGLVDLYYNDVCCLQYSIKEMKNPIYKYLSNI